MTIRFLAGVTLVCSLQAACSGDFEVADDAQVAEAAASSSEQALGPTVATLYGDINYLGTAAALSEGNYDLAALNSLGMGNDAVSSLKVSAGYTAYLFGDSGYSGRLLTKTGNVSTLVPDNFNDAVSSAIIVTPSSVTTHTTGVYRLTVINAAKLSSTILARMVQCWTQNYPAMAARFNPNAAKSVLMTIDASYTGAAYANGSTMVVSANWMNSNPYDADVVTHEEAHIIQAYPAGVPGWVTEGLADYMRYKYGDFNSQSGWALTFDPNSHYTDAYRTTARFFVWLENKRKATFPVNLNNACRNGTYTDAFWTREFGTTVDNLWSQYVANPAL